MEKCQYGEDTRLMFEKLSKRLNSNLEKMWQELKEIRAENAKKISPIVTAIIAVLTGVTGALIGALTKALM